MNSEHKAEQLERDFGVRHPLKALRAGLRAGSSEVTPFQKSTARERLNELAGKGYSEDEACIILLMRGARASVLAASKGLKFNRRTDETKQFCEGVRTALKGLSDHSVLIDESQKNLNLMRRV